VIADLGCGGGELLLVIDQWAKTKKLIIEIIGIDANPFIIEYASQKTNFNQRIHYETKNIFSPDFAHMKFDIVCINSVCHHFSDESLILLFKTLVQQVKLAILINDLNRHWMSYYTTKFATKLFTFSSLAKHDAPLSVLRAFRKQELIDIIEKAGLSSYQIRWVWPFRWEVIIWPSP
jgi:2-polyprenyl-3-methyl-5-hydroxy-6-metoxy-1,4-benzoquinol methylase